MEGSPGGGIPTGEACPKLLDLIAGGSEWMEREDRGGGGGGRNDLGAAEEQKLELRLGPPGGDDWPVVREEKEEHPVRAPGFLPRPPTCGLHASAGAKRGFMETKGLQHHQLQKPSFLRHASVPAMVNPTSQNANGSITEQLQQQQQQQSFERKAGPPASAVSPVSECAAASSRDSSQPRTAPAAVVGWPPIRSFRKNLASGTLKPPSQPETGSLGRSGKQESCSSKGMFVKINMDGIPIGRKVDLRAYDSYEKLSSAVDELFRALLAAQREGPALGGQDGQQPGQAITGLLDDGGEYTLVYEDTEGDVLLVGDVPWNMFVSAVKRLRVLKSSELPALSLAADNKKVSATEAATQCEERQFCVGLLLWKIVD